MPKTHILVVDDEPIFIELLPVLLADDERTFSTAKDGVEALAMARAERPDLIVLDIHMPGMDGFELIKELRSRAEFALTPVIFLTDSGDDLRRRHGFQLGADDFLSKQGLYDQDPRELKERVGRILAHQAELESSFEELLLPHGAGEPALSGSLSELGLPSLLTVLEMEGKTGLLEIRREDDADRGRLYLSDGRVLKVVADSSPGRNVEAVAHLLSWRDGTFAFYAQAVDVEDEIEATSTRLLLNATLLVDNAARELPSTDA